MKAVARYPLLEANVVDSQGCMFTPESLQKCVKDFELQGTLPVSKDFSTELADTYGLVTKLEIEGNVLYADIEFLDTELGRAQVAVIEAISDTAAKQYELAAGGHINTQTSKLQDVQGKDVLVIEEFKLNSTTLTRQKVK